MPQPVKLSDALVNAARTEAPVAHRSIPGQIEHWASLGRSVEMALTQAQIFRLKAGLPLDTVDSASAAPATAPPPAVAILRELRPRGRNGGRRRTAASEATTPPIALVPQPEAPFMVTADRIADAAPPPPEPATPVSQTTSLGEALRFALSPDFPQLALEVGASGQQPWIGRHARWPGALCQLTTSGGWLSGRWFAGKFELSQKETP